MFNLLWRIGGKGLCTFTVYTRTYDELRMVHDILLRTGFDRQNQWVMSVTEKVTGLRTSRNITNYERETLERVFRTVSLTWDATEAWTTCSIPGHVHCKTGAM